MSVTAPKSKKVKKTSDKPKPDTTAVISGQLKKQIVNRAKKSKPQEERGIVFVSHLPHGFYEPQIKRYFKQFGRITRLRLVRSKRTGGSKGFAYVEFEVPDVAKIAAEAMGNTQMFQKVVKAAYIPPEEQKYNYFRSSLKLVKNKAGKLRAVSTKTRKITNYVKHHNNWDEINSKKRTKLSLGKLAKLNTKLPDLGMDFSDLILAPKGVKTPKPLDAISPSNSSQEDATVESSSERNETEHETGSLLLIKKRKESSSDGKGIKEHKKKKKAKTSNKNTSLGLEALLDTTLNEDSSDEEFIPFAGSDDEELEESISDIDLEVDASSGSDSDEGASKQIKKRAKPDKFEKLLKRNPDSRGIQKPKKKIKKTAGKETLKAAAAKEIFSKQNKKNFKKMQKKAK